VATFASKPAEVKIVYQDAGRSKADQDEINALSKRI
jgi:hypothetical protein